MKRILLCKALALSLALSMTAAAQQRVTSALPLPAFTGPGSQQLAATQYPPAVAYAGMYTTEEAINDAPAYERPIQPKSITTGKPSPSPAGDYYGHSAADNDYLSGVSSSWEGDSCVGGGCGVESCASCLADRWFGGVYGLWLARDDEDHTYYSYDDNAIDEQLLRSRDANFDTGGGVDLRFGRTFCGGCYAWEFVYWGVYPGGQELNLYGADMVGSLNSTWDLSSLNYDNGVDGVTSVDTYTDAAERHRLRRDQSFTNVEINLYHMPLTWSGMLCCDAGCGLGGAMGYGSAGCGPAGCDSGCGGYGCCGSPRLHTSVSFGLRYLYFEEDLQFAASRYDADFGAVPRGEIFWDTDMENHFIGPQIGFYADYCVTNRLQANLTTKFGLYGAHINQTQRIYGHNGDAVVGAGPNAGRAYNVNSSKNDVAFMGEIDLGLKYRITQRLRLVGGYRAVAITGVAHATEQIPVYFAGIDDVENIDSSGSMILHGGYGGVELTW